MSFVPIILQATARLRIFCFPHAGAGAWTFRGWRCGLAEDVALSAVQLPGRESRIHETPIDEWPRLIDYLTAEILPVADIPFVFYGHSFGASVAYEMSVVCMQKHLPLQHLIVSGRCPPHLPMRRPPMYDLPAPAFHERLLELKGDGLEARHDEALISVMEPALRADIKLAETVRELDAPPLSVPITAYCGSSDDVAPCSAVQEWCSFTASAFSLRCFHGDHFFHNQNESELFDNVNRICARTLKGLSIRAKAQPPNQVSE